MGPVDNTLSISVDMEDLSCSSPPAPSATTPPSSPNVQSRESPWEPLELQLDYWQLPKFIETTNKTDKLTKQQDGGKISMKGLFRGLQVTPSAGSLNVAVQMSSKEKKQKSKLQVSRGVD